MLISKKRPTAGSLKRVQKNIQPKLQVMCDLETYSRQLSSSLEAARRVLTNERYQSLVQTAYLRNPRLFGSVEHKYADKFGLVGLLTNMTLVALLNCFEMLGLEMSALGKLASWSELHSVSLELKFEQRYGRSMAMTESQKVHF